MAKPKAFDPRVYTITVRRVIVDDEALFRTTVAELPDVAEFAETYEEAYSRTLETISGLKETAERQQRSFPEPFVDEEEYSGRVTFRMTKSLHRRAAEYARGEGVSLNAFLVTVVAERVGSIESNRRHMVNIRSLLAESHPLVTEQVQALLTVSSGTSADSSTIYTRCSSPFTVGRTSSPRLSTNASFSWFSEHSGQHDA